MRRGFYLALAYASLALGLAGLVLPGLPTTPFVLLAAWAAARGSERLHRWMRAHAVFGKMIRDWEAGGAVSRRAKWAASIAMALCALLAFATAPKAWMAATATTIMLVVAAWLWRRPEPRRG